MRARDLAEDYPLVHGGDSALEAAEMVRLSSPLLVIADGDRVHGVLTTSHLLALLLPGVE